MNQLERSCESLRHPICNLRMRKENHAKIARIVIPVVVGSNPISHPSFPFRDSDQIEHREAPAGRCALRNVGRRAVDEAVGQRTTPVHAGPALVFVPGDRLPVRRQHEIAAPESISLHAGPPAASGRAHVRSSASDDGVIRWFRDGLLRSGNAVCRPSIGEARAESRRQPGSRADPDQQQLGLRPDRNWGLGPSVVVLPRARQPLGVRRAGQQRLVSDQRQTGPARTTTGSIRRSSIATSRASISPSRHPDAAGRSLL